MIHWYQWLFILSPWIALILCILTGVLVRTQAGMMKSGAILIISPIITVIWEIVFVLWLLQLLPPGSHPIFGVSIAGLGIFLPLAVSFTLVQGALFYLIAQKSRLLLAAITAVTCWAALFFLFSLG